MAHLINDIDDSELYSTRLMVDMLTERRHSLGYTQADVDDLLNTTNGLCAKWESGARIPNAGSLTRWITALECTIDLIPLEEYVVE